MKQTNEPFYKLPKDLAPRRDVSAAAKVVRAVIGGRIGRNKCCWPGTRSLANDTGLSRPTVVKAIQELESKRLLVVERRQNGKVNCYRLPEKTGQIPLPLGDKTGQESLPVKNTKRSNPLTPGGKESLPEPDKNLYQNKKEPLNKNHTLPQKAPEAKQDNTGFESFWSAWPKKVEKKDAQKVWAKINPSPELIENILAAVEQQKQSEQWTKDGGQYIPGPAKWLRGERWEDQVEPANVAAVLGCAPCDEAEAKRLLQETGLWEGEL